MSNEQRTISECVGRGSRKQGGKSKRWCFTINGFKPDDVIGLRELGRGGVQYLVFGREVAPTTGMRHIQGYVEFFERIRLPAVRKLISSRAHCEIARGSPEDSLRYCSKEGDFEVFGKSGFRDGQGRRRDLEVIRDEIRKGSSDRDIADAHFSQWVIHRRSFEAYRAMCSGIRSWKSYVTVYWGPTGCGKTRRVFEQCERLWSLSDMQGRWFDGYGGEECVLFDDFASGIEFRFLLLLLDRYPMRVPVKGGFVQWLPKRIYITSNQSPLLWYFMLDDQQRAPLYRRLDEIIEMK